MILVMCTSMLYLKDHVPQSNKAQKLIIYQKIPFRLIMHPGGDRFFYKGAVNVK